VNPNVLPSRADAEALLREAGALNPGPWTAHSGHVARAAERIAARAARRIPALDPDAAYIVGLLHDIGRRAGVTGMRHVYDGYRYLMAAGYEPAARVAMTHSFAYRNVAAIFGAWDCTADELRVIEDYLAAVEYDDYDRLIQLCDSLAMAEGYVLMEKRMLDVLLRYGPNEYVVPKWQATFRLRDDFEAALGCSVYSLLPGVVENTFGAWANERT